MLAKDRQMRPLVYGTYIPVLIFHGFRPAKSVDQRFWTTSDSSIYIFRGSRIVKIPVWYLHMGKSLILFVGTYDVQTLKMMEIKTSTKQEDKSCRMLFSSWKIRIQVKIWRANRARVSKPKTESESDCFQYLKYVNLSDYRVSFERTFRETVSKRNKRR